MAKLQDLLEELKHSGESLTGDSLGEASTFNAQCFLIQHMFEIAPLAEAKRAINVESKRNRNPDIDSNQTPDLGQGSQGFDTDAFVASPASAPGGTAPQRVAATSAAMDEFERNAYPLSGYTYIAPVLSNSSIPPSETYSKLTQMRTAAGCKLSAGLLDFTTDKMAMLVPRLRVYKVEYESEESETPSGDFERRPKLDEATDIEVIFDDFVRGATLERMFSERQGRLSGTGIKSFEWSLKGVNPADIDKNIEAKLVIHFNDVSDLFTDCSGNRQTLAGRKGVASFLDLIIYAPNKSMLSENEVAQGTPNPEVPSYLLYNGKFFEIKIEVGWQVPPNKSGFFSTEEMDAIKNSQTPLYLQLTKHQFEFKQDGSADLVINYRARYSNLDNRFDLYNVSEESKTAKQLRESQEKLAELGAAPKAWQRHRKLGGESKAERKTRERALKNEARAMKDYQDRYSKLLKRLVGGATAEKPCKLLDVYAQPIQLRAFKQKNSEDPTGISVSAYKRKLSALRTPAQRSVPNLAMAAGQSGARGFAELLANTPYMFDKFEELGYFKKVTRVHSHQDVVDGPQWDNQVIEGRIKEALDADTKSDHKGKLEKQLVGGDPYLAASRARGDKVRLARASQAGVPLTFFLLGDLIDTIIDTCENFMDDHEATGFKEEILKARAGFITTDIEFIDVRNFYDAAVHWSAGSSDTFFRKLKFKELSFSKDDRKRLYKPINIASIPISYEYFVEWYINKVVKPKRGEYYFNHMIRDILVELVAPSLSSGCFYGVPPTKYQVSQLDFLADRDSMLSTALYGGPSPRPGSQVPRCHYVSDLTTFPSAANPALPRTLTVDAKRGNEDDFGNRQGSDVHRVFKTLVATTPSMLAFESGSPEIDRSRGVYHFIVGADTGILKSATFTRVDAPFMREARVSRDRTAGAEQLRELYNVNLVLFGNPLIKPGQYIYVIPSPLGFGDPRSVGSFARYLGIGGYHLVTSVTNTISQKGYETKVTALHQALPYTETTDLTGPGVERLAAEQ